MVQFALYYFLRELVMNNSSFKKIIVLFFCEVFIFYNILHSQNIIEFIKSQRINENFVVITYNLSVCKSCRSPLSPYIEKLSEIHYRPNIYVLFNKDIDDTFTKYLCKSLKIDTNYVKVFSSEPLFNLLQSNLKDDIHFYLISKAGKIITHYNMSNFDKFCKTISKNIFNNYKVKFYRKVLHPLYKDNISKYMLDYILLSDQFVIWNPEFYHLSFFDKKGNLLKEFYLDTLGYTDIILAKRLLPSNIFEQQKKFFYNKKNEVNDEHVIEYKDIIKINDTLFALMGYVNYYKDSIYKKDSIIYQYHYPFILILNQNLKLIKPLYFNKRYDISFERGGLFVDSLFYFFVYEKHKKQYQIFNFKLLNDSLLTFNHSINEPINSTKLNYIPKFVYPNNIDTLISIVYYFDNKSMLFFLNKNNYKFHKIITLKKKSIHTINHYFLSKKEFIFGAYNNKENKQNVYYYNFYTKEIYSIPFNEETIKDENINHKIYFLFDKGIHIIAND